MFHKSFSKKNFENGKNFQSRNNFWFQVIYGFLFFIYTLQKLFKIYLLGAFHKKTISSRGYPFYKISSISRNSPFFKTEHLISSCLHSTYYKFFLSLGVTQWDHPTPTTPPTFVSKQYHQSKFLQLISNVFVFQQHK